MPNSFASGAWPKFHDFSGEQYTSLVPRREKCGLETRLQSANPNDIHYIEKCQTVFGPEVPY